MKHRHDEIRPVGVPQRSRGTVLLALLGKLLLATAGLAVATPVLVLFVAGRCDIC